MNMAEGYGDSGKPVADKSQFVMSLFEQLDKEEISPIDRSIIDRCVALVYADYRKTKRIPTLRSLRSKLLEQNEPKPRSWH